jgi:hypothetical protein
MRLPISLVCLIAASCQAFSGSQDLGYRNSYLSVRWSQPERQSDGTTRLKELRIQPSPGVEIERVELCAFEDADSDGMPDPDGYRQTMVARPEPAHTDVAFAEVRTTSKEPVRMVATVFHNRGGPLRIEM